MARINMADLADSEVEEPQLKTKAAGRLTLVPVRRIRPNDVNPRTDFGPDEDLLALGRSIGRKQLQAIRAVTRGAYVELFPEYDDQVPDDIDVIIVNGARRHRAASAARLESLEVVIDDDLANSKKVFLDAVMAENIDRQNFDPIEEAHGLDALVREFGSADAVAQHYGRHKSWVSQRRSLLKLTGEVQQLVRSGEIPFRRARELASLPPENQMATWEASKTPGPVAASNPETAPSSPAASGVKEPKQSNGKRVRERAAAPPWDSPDLLAAMITEHLSPADLATLVKILRAEVAQ